MAWEVEYTDQFAAWFGDLDEKTQDAINGAVMLLESRGPGLGRPYADSIKTSRHPHMKELRPPRANIRVLFAFDPRRAAILLIGGDKSHRWQSWYQEAVPLADRLYDEYLEELRQEGSLP
jgi:hypothetical protein